MRFSFDSFKNKLKKDKLKRFAAVALTAVFMTVFAVSVVADEPYTAFDYDWWDETIPAQNGYVVDRVLSGADLGFESGLKSPSDVFIYNKTGEVYIADTGNNRIIVTDSDFEDVIELKTFEYGEKYTAKKSLIGTTTTLNRPQGVFVMETRGEKRLYIADHDNGRVLSCYYDEDGEWKVWMEYVRPQSHLYDEGIAFQPKKVVVDSVGNVYICIKSITRGAVVFAEDGSFSGYYGANRVERNFNAILNNVLKYILTSEQMEQRVKPVPVEFSNFTIDNDGFIYTVTESKSANLDVLKKLDPAGRNVFEQQGYDEMVWGAFVSPYVNGRQYTSQIIDVSVDESGNIYLMDFTSGKIFQYDYEGSLMFIFGGNGEQKGLFNTPTAIETYNEKVYVLDGVKNSITVYKLTEFGELVNEAMGLYNRGLYAEAEEPWLEILKRDANYWQAYSGMGNAMLSLDRFEEALDYFYMHSRSGYNRAFKDFRIDYIRENFDKFTVAAVAVIVILTALNIFLKRRRKNMQASDSDKQA